jgi:hypothetical protein
LNDSKNKTSDSDRSSNLFSGRGPPALMSTKEPAINMLKERYRESFAITKGIREGQVHLFLIKQGMWSLVWTFTARDLDRLNFIETKRFEIRDALKILESELSKENSIFLKKLDLGVSNALNRIQSKIEQIKRPGLA